MVQKYALRRIAHWLRTNREQLDKVTLEEVKDRMIKEGNPRSVQGGQIDRPQS